MCSLLGWLGDCDYASTYFKVDALRLDLGHCPFITLGIVGHDKSAIECQAILLVKHSHTQETGTMAPTNSTEV